MTTSGKQIRERTDEVMAALWQRADDLATEIWNLLEEGNRQRKRWERVTLRPRVRKLEETGGTLVIEWFQIIKKKKGKDEKVGTSDKDKAKPHYKSLTKGKGPRYTSAVLRKHVKDWAWDLVNEYEDRFEICRKMGATVGRIRRNCGHLDRWEEQLNGGDAEATLETGT